MNESDCEWSASDHAGDDILLPNPREVNKQIAQEARQVRERERSGRRRGMRHWVNLVQDAQRRRPNDLFRQFTYCLRVGKIPAGTGRMRNVGNETQKKFGTDCKHAFKELRREGVNVRNLSELSGKHVIVLVNRWSRNRLSAATITGRVAALRKLLVLLGKPEAVPTGAVWKRILEANGIDPAVLRRSQIPTEPKSASAQGIRPEDLIARLGAEHRHERSWLGLQLQFGLRPRECAMIDPHESDRGDHLLVLHGAKANRKRIVKFSKNPERRAAQRAALDDAKHLALEHPQFKLHSRDRNTKQALNHFYYLMRKCGITKAALGVIPYALRHEFANAEFEEVAGLPAPVLGKVHPTEYAAVSEKVAAAEQHVVLQLGHSDKTKSGAYNGTVHAEYRRDKRRLATMNMVSSNQRLDAAVRCAGIREVWLVGKAARGLPLAKDESLELAVSAAARVSSDAVLELLVAVQTLPQPVALTWCSTRPDGGLEVIFPHQR